MGKRRGVNATKSRTESPNRSPGIFGPKAAETALVIFAKAPIPGQVKTRLCPPLTPDEAATLHGTFVLDALERSRGAVKQFRVSVDRFVACSPSTDHAFFKVLEARHGVHLLPQIGDDLGARMSHAFQHAFTLGYRYALLTGTDLPLLPGSSYADAIKLLADHDVVLGPALDGGYYLIGLKRLVPDLFADIPWSTNTVLSLTVKKAEALGLRTGLLPVCRDVDRLEDLLALIEEMKIGQGASVEGPAGKKAKRTASSPLTSHPSPLTPVLSRRTAGVLQTLASRLRTRAGHREHTTGEAAGSSV